MSLARSVGSIRRGKETRTPESIVLASVLAYLKLHRSVAWVQRVNTGMGSFDGRKVKFGFRGCSDIIGQLRDGRFLAIEVKAEKGRVTDLQQQFIDQVVRNGGVGGVARSIDDAKALLEAL